MLAAHNMVVQDEFGNIVNGASVEVRREEAGAPLAALYSDPDGSSSLGNPFIAVDGSDVRFHCVGGRYKITVTKDAETKTRRYEGIGLAAGTDFGGGDETTEEFTGASATIAEGTTNVVVNRVSPAATALELPDASTRGGRPLRIADMSTSVTDHAITLTPADPDQKIMRQSTWPIYSNATQLGSVTLIPVIDPDDGTNHIWIIAP